MHPANSLYDDESVVFASYLIKILNLQRLGLLFATLSNLRTNTQISPKMFELPSLPFPQNFIGDETLTLSLLQNLVIPSSLSVVCGEDSCESSSEPDL